VAFAFVQYTKGGISMAIVKMAQPGTLSIKFQTGVNGTGNPTYSTRNYSGVKPASTDQALFDVASAIAEVVKHTLSDIIRQDKSNLISQ